MKGLRLFPPAILLLLVLGSSPATALSTPPSNPSSIPPLDSFTLSPQTVYYLPGGIYLCIVARCPGGALFNLTVNSTGTSVSGKPGLFLLGNYFLCTRAMANSSIGFQGCFFDDSSYTVYGVPSYAMCLGPSGGSVRVGVCFMTAPHPYVRYWCSYYAPGIIGYGECYL